MSQMFASVNNMDQLLNKNLLPNGVTSQIEKDSSRNVIINYVYKNRVDWEGWSFEHSVS